MPELSLFDQPVFSIHDVLRITGLKMSRIAAYKHRRLFRPQYPQGRGGAKRGPNYVAAPHTYTMRDVLRIDLLAAVSSYNPPPKAFDTLRHNLDAAITAFEHGTKTRERLLVPAHAFAPWCLLSLNLSALVEMRVKSFQGKSNRDQRGI